MLRGHTERIPCFSLFMCTILTLPSKLVLFQPSSFLSFTLPILSSIAPGAIGCVQWLAGVIAQHKYTPKIALWYSFLLDAEHVLVAPG